MEHWLTILAIKSFLDEQKQFRQQNPAADALTDLDEWEASEAANPRTFLNMYLFSICKKGAGAAAPAIAARIRLRTTERAHRAGGKTIMRLPRERKCLAFRHARRCNTTAGPGDTL